MLGQQVWVCGIMPIMFRLGLSIAASTACMACGFSVGGVTDGPLPDVSDAPPDTVLGNCAPVEVKASGDHTCARTNDGATYCWGRGENGELGVAPLTESCSAPAQDCSSTPRLVSIPAATALGTGTFHVCATTAATTYCWGYNGLGQYGDGATADAVPTKAVAQRAGATEIEGGTFHTCSLLNGHVSCSGKNDAGEVGDNTIGTPQITATDVMQNATSLATGAYNSCAIDGNHDVYCWGRNSYKQIDVTQLDKLKPTKVTTVSNAQSVASGTDHVCVTHPDKTAQCWGSNTVGQIGNGLTSPSPQPPLLVAVPAVVEIRADLYHTCVRDDAGAIWCFGEGYAATPVKIALPRPAIAFATGGHHDCAITDDHTLYCWGGQEFGQLGNGIKASSRTTTPQKVTLCP